MDKQTRKIAEFLNGITDASLPAEQQVMLFSQEENEEGGVGNATENDKCTNKAVGCGGSTNTTCKNYDTNCGDTKNTGCETLNSQCKCEGPNGRICEILNSSIASCGG